MSDKIQLKEKIGYGLGDAASSMFWKLFSMYLLFFYTDIFGIPAAVVGTMFLITRIWDSLIDPLIGIKADRTNTKYGKFRPYILWFAIPFGLAGILTFTTPDLSVNGKIIYAYVTYTAMMLVYSLVNVPYASLLGVISPDPKERTTLSAYRMTFAFLGSIVALALVEPLVNFFSTFKGSTDLKFGWQMTIVVFAVIVIAMFFGLFFLTKERVKPIQDKRNSLKEDLTDLFKNRPWWILLVASVGVLILNSIRDGAAVYYFKYFVTNNETMKLSSLSFSLTTLYLVLGQIANIVGIFFVTPVSKKIGKKNTFMISMIIAAIFSIIFFFVEKENIILILTLQVLISICAGSVFPLMWSMYADTADYSELNTKRRATGLIFSASSMSQKLGWTLGGAITGWLLGYYGFQANVVQTSNAQEGIRLIMSIFPACGALVAALVIFFYPLNQKKMNEIEVDLNKLRGQ